MPRAFELSMMLISLFGMFGVWSGLGFIVCWLFKAPNSKGRVDVTNSVLLFWPVVLFFGLTVCLPVWAITGFIEGMNEALNEHKEWKNENDF